MKERPILFSAPMVRAILAGTKKQTRRIVEPQPRPDATWAGGYVIEARDGSASGIQSPLIALRCRYGQPGDRLWVRESLGYDCEWGHYFAADRKFLCELFDDEEAGTGPSYDHRMPDRSIPSIHLPRRYSRILLEITSVRAERLQDISEADALEEGVTELSRAVDRSTRWHPVSEFSALWQSINGTDSWAANPWVWVLAFKRLEQET